MPLPGSLTTITVTGTYLKFDGTPESGVVQFVNQAFLQSASDNVIVAYGTTTVTLDSNGEFTAVLPATNDPQWVPIGFTYNVYERLSTARRSYVISLPYDGGPVNLADVAPVEAVPPTGSFLPLIGGVITGNLGVNGVTTLTNATISGSASIGSNLAVTGNQTVTGTLGVTGNTSLTNNLSVGGSGVVTGNLLVNGTTTAKFGTGLTVDVGEILSTVVSTGVVSGGELNANVDPSKVDISAMVGYILDYITNPSNPVFTRVSIPSQTVAMDAGSLARITTWWLVDSSGNIIQQGPNPTNVQRRTHIVLGATAQFGGSIFIDQTLPGYINHQPGAQFVDLMASLGPFSVSGNVITPNGTNLMINTTGGTLFIRGTNHFSGPTLTNDPHISTTVAQSPASFRYATRNTVFPTVVNTVDVGNYDLNGVVTAIPGGAGTSTVHRIWIFAANATNDQMTIQYGQNTYSSLANAVASIGTGTYIPNPLFVDGVLAAHLVATKVAIDLSDTAQATFHRAAKFDHA